MMGFFKQPKPRRFSHPFQYVDERKERIKEIEMRAKKELDCRSLSGLISYVRHSTTIPSSVSVWKKVSSRRVITL